MKRGFRAVGQRWYRDNIADVMLERGVPEHIRSDNGAEMTAKIVRSQNFRWMGSSTMAANREIVT